MWSINKLKNKAVEKLNSVKRNGIDKDVDAMLEEIRSECEMLKVKVAEQERIIEDMGKDRVNFRVFIGKMEHGDKVTEFEIEEFRRLEEGFKKELEEEKNKVEELLNQRIVSKVQNEKEMEELNEKIRNGAEEIGELRRETKEISDQFGKYRTRVNTTISDIFQITKDNFCILGLSMPSVRPEDLGLEDLKEFLYTSNQHLINTINSLNDVSKEVGKPGKTLEDFAELFKHSLSICTDAKKSSEEILRNNENLQKEKEEVIKSNKKQTERIKILFEEVKKNNENLKIIEGLKEDAKKQGSKILEILEKNKELEKENNGLKGGIKSLQGKLKIKADECEQVLENSDNLKKRLKNLNSALAEKDKNIESLTEEKQNLELSLKKSLLEIEAAKLHSEQVTNEIKQEASKELEDLKSTLDSQIETLNMRLKESKNDQKNSTIELIQLNNKLKKMLELEQNYSTLCQENLRNLEKFESLTEEFENLKKKALLKKETKKLLKQRLTELNMLVEELKVQIGSEQGKREEVRGELGKALMENEIFKEKVRMGEKPGVGFIDKRMIATFLVNYFSDKNSASAKKQMVRALSEMLEMSEEQKMRIGQNIEVSFYSQLTGFLSRT